MNFFENSTGINLLFFFKNKIDAFYSFIKSLEEIDKFALKYNCEIYFSSIINSIYSQEKINLDEQKKLLKNYLTSREYNILEPKYEDYKTWFNHQILLRFHQEEAEAFKNFNDKKLFIKYYQYNQFSLNIWYNELIETINKTEFHKDKKLNELFKQKAINYIMDGDSLLNLFLDELLKSIISHNNLHSDLILKIKVNPEMNEEQKKTLIFQNLIK